MYIALATAMILAGLFGFGLGLVTAANPGGRDGHTVMLLIYSSLTIAALGVLWLLWLVWQIFSVLLHF